MGIIMPKLDFPAVFENGNLLGIRANAPIHHREMILAVPCKSFFTVAQADQIPALK